MEPFYNPNIAALPKYNSGQTLAAARAASGRQFISRLGSNENPHGASPAVQQALAGIDFGRYSDPGCEELRAALGQRLGVDPAVIVIGNGSEEMIAATARSFLAPGSKALTVVPSFGLHEIEPLAVGATVAKVTATPGLAFDIDALEAALALAPDLFLLSSPSNPLGAALDAAGLQRMIRALRPGTMLLLDEAYREFASPEIPDGITELRRAAVPHVVLRTFSKAWGLAGLRIGYAVCSSPRIASMLRVAKTPFNVNAMAQAAAVAALADSTWMLECTARIRSERGRVANGLHALGIRVAPSEGNFLFFDTGRASAEVATQLLASGVIVKPWLEPGYQTFIRASIGSTEENDQFLAALEQILRPPRYASAR